MNAWQPEPHRSSQLQFTVRSSLLISPPSPSPRTFQCTET